MSTLATPPTAPSSLERAWSLAELEMSLLWRNKTAVVTAVGFTPVLVVLGVRVFDRLAGGHLTASLTVLLATFTLLLGSYYNLTTATVARREEGMLKRLTAGEVSRAEVLVAIAVPHFLLALVQTALAFVGLSLTVGTPNLTYVFLAFLAFLGGAVMLSLLAFATSGKTRTVESAQLTTMPLLMVAPAFGGLFFPLDVLPDAVRTVAELTPLAPVVALLRVGLGAAGPDGTELVAGLATTGRPLAVLLAWLVLAAYLARRSTRWDARR